MKDNIIKHKFKIGDLVRKVQHSTMWCSGPDSGKYRPLDNSINWETATIVEQWPPRKNAPRGLPGYIVEVRPGVYNSYDESQLKLYIRPKIGDKVIIHERSILKQYTGVVDRMEQYAGKECTIIGGAIDGFKLDIDNGYWTWYTALFELVPEEKFIPIKAAAPRLAKIISGLAYIIDYYEELEKTEHPLRDIMQYEEALDNVQNCLSDLIKSNKGLSCAAAADYNNLWNSIKILCEKELEY